MQLDQDLRAAMKKAQIRTHSQPSAETRSNPTDSVTLSTPSVNRELLSRMREETRSGSISKQIQAQTNQSLTKMTDLLSQLKSQVSELTDSMPSSLPAPASAPPALTIFQKIAQQQHPTLLRYLERYAQRSTSQEHSETRLEFAVKALGVEKGREYAVHSLEVILFKLARDDEPWSIIMDEMNKEVSIAESAADTLDTDLGPI